MVSLDDLADCELPSEGLSFFIICELQNCTKTKKVLIAKAECDGHNEVYKQYLLELPEDIRVTTVHGGGQIEISKNKIYAHSKSAGYGMANQKLVEEFLKNYISENKIEAELEVSMGYW